MTTTNAEKISTVVGALRAGHFKAHIDPVVAGAARKRLKKSGPVVDCSDLYPDVTDMLENKSVTIYDDFPSVAPPWENAVLAYVNAHGNVDVIELDAVEIPEDVRGEAWWSTAEDCDWARVRWIVSANMYVGGQDGTGRRIQPHGPLHAQRIAVYEDGQIGDLSWVQLEEKLPKELFTYNQIMILYALNFMNCRNVELVEPDRPRAEARRIARNGVSVSNINVFRSVKRVLGANGQREGGIALSSVRGHFSEYGPEFGKGLLFGKYSGRFWMPQHVRGTKDGGKFTEQKFTLKAG